MALTAFKQVKNNVKSYVASNSLNNTTASLTFAVDDGSKFPIPGNGFWVTAWDYARYSNPGDDPNMRIGLCTARTDNNLTVTWGQLGTSIVAMPGAPMIAVLIVDQHFIDLYTAVNTLENDHQHKLFITVGSANADYVTDGVADDVQIQQAIDTVNAAGGGIVQLKAGTFTQSNTIMLRSNVILQGLGPSITKLFVLAGTNKTSINNFDYNNGITSRAGVRNLTIDGNGANQVSAGGGLVTSGMQDWIVENVVFEKSYRFNFLTLHSSGAIANGAGTITVTSGSEVITGALTIFLTTFAENDIIKTAGGRFGRIAKVVSDTELHLTRAWGHATESAVTYKKILPNSNNKFINVRAKGTVFDADSMGFGFCDYSVVENCISSGAAGGGCGLVPDHARGMQFIGCETFDNQNSGLSLETCQDTTIVGGKYYRNGNVSGNGIQFISGTYNTTVFGVHSFNNKSNGLIINYNVNTFPTPDSNKVINSYFYHNNAYGVRIDGGNNNEFMGCNAYNNTSGGFLTNTSNSRIPTDNKFINCRAYDNRTIKVQARGFYIVTGVNTLIAHSKANDNVTAQIADTGTGTVQLDVNGTTNVAGRTTLGLGSIATQDASSVAITGGIITGINTLTLATSTPALATSSGVVGTITWDANYIYVCVATNTWKRIGISTW